MPNRSDHKNIGLASGVGFSLYRAKNEKFEDALLEAAGGALGGWLFSTVPDVIDPPTHPGHRSFGHGMVPALAIGSYYLQNLDAWQEKLREISDAKLQESSRTDSIDDLLMDFILALSLRFAAGFIAGAGAGYASHLLMDARTAKGLPIVA